MDRKALLLAAAAVPLGLAGGYAWSAMSAPAALAPAPAKGTTVVLPASPEELPQLRDEEWTARADDGATVTYAGCNEVRAAGKAPLYAGEPGYDVKMDGDGDGIACEPIRS